jgi:cytoskeleton protein RodZ
MTSIGESLRHERLRRNLDLEAVSRELKISPRFLEAIEAGRLDKLPGGVFAKSFARQYARYLGLDEDEIAGEVQRAVGAGSSIPEFAATPRTAPVDIRVPRVDSMENFGGSGRFSFSSSLPALAAVVLAMFSCAAVYSWITRHPSGAPQQSAQLITQKPQTPLAAPVSGPPAAQDPHTASATDQAGTVPTRPAGSPATPAQTGAIQTPAPQGTPQPQSTAAQAAPAAAAPTAVPPAISAAAPRPPGAAAPVRIQITADEPVWLLARTDGKYSFSGTLESNQTRMVEADGAITLRLGNAGGVNITLNGKPIGAVGPKGQPCTIQFTSGGFKIVAAPKVSVPLDPFDRL